MAQAKAATQDTKPSAPPPAPPEDEAKAAETTSAPPAAEEKSADLEGADPKLDTPSEAPKRKIHKPTRLHQMQHAVMTWHHTAEMGEVPEDFATTDVFAHVAKSLRVGHEIIVVAAEGTWRLHLYVRAVGRNEVHTGLIQFSEFGKTVELSEDSPFEVRFRGPSAQWSVIRRGDGAVIKEHFQTKEQAAEWVRNHIAALDR